MRFRFATSPLQPASRPTSLHHWLFVYYRRTLEKYSCWGAPRLVACRVWIPFSCSTTPPFEEHQAVAVFLCSSHLSMALTSAIALSFQAWPLQETHHITRSGRAAASHTATTTRHTHTPCPFVLANFPSCFQKPAIDLTHSTAQHSTAHWLPRLTNPRKREISERRPRSISWEITTWTRVEKIQRKTTAARPGKDEGGGQDGNLSFPSA
jgi:hypothetical protein